MALTDLKLRKAKGRDKPYKIADGGGLYVLIQPTGAVYWRYDYKMSDKRKTMALGIYPDVSLERAREKHKAARTLVADGTDPIERAKEEEATKAVAESNTFGKVALEYIDHLRALGRAEATITKNTWLLTDLAAQLGKKPITKIKAGDILPVLKKVEVRGNRDSAHTLRATIGSVFRFAISQPSMNLTHDPTWALRGSLLPVEEGNFAAITEERPFGGLLRAVDEYDSIIMRSALQIMALCFPRPGELRKSEWSHFDLDGNMAVWTIPAHLAKMRREHDIPLSWQARDILKRLKLITGDGKYAFPSLRSRKKIISENGLNAALRRMGFTKLEHTAHGFRASASTILNGRKFDHDVIERALAHLEPNKVRRAYNRYEYWDERIELAQKWADICDELKARKRRNHDDII